MGEILGVGATHYPPGLVPDEYKPWPLARMLQHDKRIPAEMKDPANWPEEMRKEWGDDEGITSHKAHRERVLKAFQKIRDEIDAFNPDFILIWGDDQYENFKEDIIPPFCVLAYDEIEFQPFKRTRGRPNIWGEPEDKVFRSPGHQEAGRYLVTGLINNGVDMAYAYKPLHEEGLGHAFANTLLYLDQDRSGFNYPILPVAVNCYGSNVIRNKGGAITQKVNGVELPFDPPGPSPKRCMELGAATARVMKDSPYKVALVASSSWSHAFLTPKNNWLWPDLESDYARFEELRDGDYDAWKRISTDQIEDAGQQELLNWMCLAGAMQEMGRKPEILDYVETYVFNSNKCLALFSP